MIWYLLTKKENPDNHPEKRFVRVWTGFIAFCFLAVCLVLIDANLLGHGARYGSLSSYLVFNDQWGTQRGFIWRKSLEFFGQFPLSHKLFGFGPDTFGILTTKTSFKEMLATTGQIFDTAHNEYLQYLLTIGPIALIAYLVFLINSCQHMIRTFRKSLVDGDEVTSYTAGCFFAVICYSFQAFVNLNLPIITPFLWILLSMGIAYVRKYKKSQNLNS